MFWDKVSGLYNLYENIYNGKVNRQICAEVADKMDASDRVLECACGAGMITKAVAPRCRELVATDFSTGMLKRSRKKCKDLTNVIIETANIMNLQYQDEAFDKVVAGNVIHLLEEPHIALGELERVCKKGGKIIIPTYMLCENNGRPDIFIRIWNKLGAGFKCQFSYHTYKEFFDGVGYSNVEYKLVQGKLPCAIAVITK